MSARAAARDISKGAAGAVSTGAPATSSGVTRTSLDSLGSGAQVSMNLVLESKRVRQTKGGTPYLLATLGDASGSVRGVKFDYQPEADISQVGSVVAVQGAVEVFKGTRRIKIRSMEPVTDANAAELHRVSSKPIAEMSAEYGAIVQAIESLALREAVKRVLRTDGLYAAFKRAPLATEGYGAWDGGALEHTLRVARLAISACESEPEVDRDLVVAAALLHQVGAVDALTVSPRPSMTARGRVLPRATLSLIRIQGGLGNPEHRVPVVGRLEELVAFSSEGARGGEGFAGRRGTLEETVLRGSIELAYSVGRRVAASRDATVVSMRRVG